jgi:hypothetical protein
MTTETIDHHRLKELLRTLLLPEWQRTLVDAVGDRLVADLRADARRGDIHSRASAFPKDQKPAAEPEQPVNKSGWVESPALKPPAGVDMVDKLAAAADLADRIQWLKRGGPV